MLLASAMLTALLALQPLALAGVTGRQDRTLLSGSVHPSLRRAQLVGSAPAGMALDRMILALRMPEAARAELERLLADQQDPASPGFHQWLSPEEFGARFGVAQERLDATTAWLRGQGFRVDEVSPGRLSLQFSGTKEQVEAAFLTRIDEVLLDGVVRHANGAELSIPSELADVVQGVVSVHDIPRAAHNTGFRPIDQPVQSKVAPAYSSGGGHYVAPGDFATIYNVAPLYAGGISGAGTRIAIVGRCNIKLSDVRSFRTSFGLPANDPEIVVNPATGDPGVYDAGEAGEALLDVQWSGAVARNATIRFVVSSSTASSDGVDLSAQYIVDHNVAPIMSTSFGLCEDDLGSAENGFFNALWQRAAAQGITSFVSTGDNGVAGCDPAGAKSGTKRAVSGLASTPYNVAVGGTMFDDAASAGQYWTSTNSSGNASAKGYIPELPWNESGGQPGGSGLWAGSGGASKLYAKPSWQTGLTPADGHRDLPDVSLAAASKEGYIVIQDGQWGVVGGTSASSPAFAGLMALIVQKTGQSQGNANPRFYALAQAQYGSGGPAVFHDVARGDNGVPGVAGYTAGAGYDQAAGLGTVDATALVNAWSTTPPTSDDFSVSLIPASQPLAAGATATFTVTTAVIRGSAVPLDLSAAGLPAGVSALFAGGGATAHVTAGQSTTIVVSATTAAPNGSVLFSVRATQSSGAGAGLARDASAEVLVSGGTDVVRGNPSNCPLGELDLFGICIPLGCSSSGAPAGWLAAIALSLLGLTRRRRHGRA
jgi:MYXO-CTERM domain-containing protein